MTDQDQRSELARLACRMQRIMRLDADEPGGVVLIGATAERGDFDLGLHGSDRMSFGGRGWTEEDALVTCLGEAAELLSFHERRDDPLVTEVTAPSLDSTQTAWAETLSGGPLAHRPGVQGQWLSGDPVIFPVDLVLRRPPCDRTSYRPAESTGLSAGPDLAQALDRALLEVVERDAVALWWWGAASARPLQMPYIAAPGRSVHCLDITSDIGIPVVVAISASASNDAIVMGFAADRTLSAAADRAYLEMRQMETALKLSFAKLQQAGAAGLSPGDRATLDRAFRLSLDTHPWLQGDVASTRAKYVAPESSPLSEILRQANLHACWFDLTRPGIDIATVRALVPGLQPIKPGAVTNRLADMIARDPGARPKDLPAPT